MAPRSLLQLLTAITAATVFTETAQAAVYREPDLNNPLEGRIQALREGSWQPLLKADRLSTGGAGVDPEALARYWGNGGGRAWGNGGGRAWGNGGGWGNGGRYYGWGNGIGWPNGGWGNGGGWGNLIPGGFVNW